MNNKEINQPRQETPNFYEYDEDAEKYVYGKTTYIKQGKTTTSKTRNPNDYTNCKIYSIRNSINSSTYIRSTWQKLSERTVQHRNDCKRKRQQGMNILHLMFELGVGHFYIELVENFSCNTSDELRKTEGELMRELKPDLSKKIECKTQKEFLANNCELEKQKCKEYKQNHQHEIKEKSHQYYEKNKQYILEKIKEYNKHNREKVRETRGRYHISE